MTGLIEALETKLRVDTLPIQFSVQNLGSRYLKVLQLNINSSICTNVCSNNINKFFSFHKYFSYSFSQDFLICPLQLLESAYSWSSLECSGNVLCYFQLGDNYIPHWRSEISLSVAQILCWCIGLFRETL